MGSASASPDAVLHLAALHTLAEAGFASTSRAASLTLSSVVSRYLRLVAQACIDRANLAGRSKVAAIDVVQALDDLGVSGVGDLHEWAVGFEKEAVFNGGNERVEEAGLEKALVEVRLVHEDELELERDGEDENQEMKLDEDEVTIKEEPPVESEPDPAPRIRFTSPDLSWLPPLPGHSPPPAEAFTTNGETFIPSAPTLSIAERYRRPIPYSQSQLSQAYPFLNPPHPSTSSNLRPAPSSFPSLISTFEATSSDPSIAFRQTPLRQQATELLRRSIATAEPYSPLDTLVSPIPPPRTTPIVPSHSDILPQHFIPLNPNPTGLLASLVHQIHSPNLPPALRDRLTSLRAPQPQIRDGVPILYGDPVRGGDNAMLAKARGKQPDPTDEAYLRATWDSGPKGIEKWGRGKLPTGRKVVQSGVGEDKPREPEGSGDKGGAGRTLKIKLSGGEGGGVSPGLLGGGTAMVGKIEKSPTPGAGGMAIGVGMGVGTGNGTASGTASGTAIKFRFSGTGLPGKDSDGPQAGVVLSGPGEGAVVMGV